jgi:hypothetical protein
VKEIEPDKFRGFVVAMLANPQEIWHEAFQRQISDYARSVILALFSFGGKVGTNLLSPAWTQLSNFQARKYNYPLSRDGFEGALKEVEGSFITIEKGSVEFLNPSVKDFVSNEVIKRPERLNDLIETSLGFQQLVTLWRWSSQSKPQPGSVLAAQITANELFVSAAEASLARPYREVLRFAAGSTERQLDLYPEERLAGLLAMAEGINAERLVALIPEVVKSILDRWKDSEPEFEIICNILRFMEQGNWCKSRIPIRVYEDIRYNVLIELANASSFYAFYWVDDFFKTTLERPKDDEVEAFSNNFDDHIKSSFFNDLSNIQYNGDELNEMGNFMSDMMDRNGYNIALQYNSVMQAIGERDHRDEARADELQEHWRDTRSSEMADEDAISSMFDSLK